MSLLNSVKSILQGHAAANELLKHGETTETVTEQSLYTLAHSLDIADPEQFVAACQNELEIEAETQAMPPPFWECLKFW